MMTDIKIELDAWSEAETDFNSAREIAGLLSHELHLEGHKQYSDIAYAIERLIESGLAWIDGGKIIQRPDNAA